MDCFTPENNAYLPNVNAFLDTLTEILYEAPESLVSGLASIFLTSLPGVKAYSGLICWNFGVNFLETKTFPSRLCPCSVNRSLITGSCHAIQILHVSVSESMALSNKSNQ